MVAGVFETRRGGENAPDRSRERLGDLLSSAGEVSLVSQVNGGGGRKPRRHRRCVDQNGARVVPTKEKRQRSQDLGRGERAATADQERKKRKLATTSWS